MQRTQDEVTYSKDQIAAIHDRNDAINKVASQDGLYSLPELISLLQDIRKITEDHIEILLKKITGARSLEKYRSDKYQKDADVFVKYGQDVLPEFKVKVKQKISSLSKDTIDSLIQINVDAILKKIASDAAKKENENLIKLLISYLQTEFFLIAALVLYNDLDYKQNHEAETIAKEGMNAFKGLFKSKDAPTKRDEIEAPFHIVTESSKYISINHKTLKLWHQIERWLMGLHYRSYNLYPEDQKDAQGNIKKNAAGEYVGVKGNVADAYLTSHGVCKYSISFYHRRCAEAIFERANNFKETPEESAFFSELEHQPVVKAVTKIEKPKTKEKIATFLSRYKDDPFDVQFSVLIDAVDHCEMEEEDERRLKKYLDSSKKKIESYNEARFSTWWVPTFFVPRRHAAITKEALGKIKESEDVRYHLTALYDLWVDTDGKGSRDIHPAVTEVLTGAFAILTKGALHVNDSPKI